MLLINESSFLCLAPVFLGTGPKRLFIDISALCQWQVAFMIFIPRLNLSYIYQTCHKSTSWCRTAACIIHIMISPICLICPLFAGYISESCISYWVEAGAVIINHIFIDQGTLWRKTTKMAKMTKGLA